MTETNQLILLKEKSLFILKMTKNNKKHSVGKWREVLILKAAFAYDNHDSWNN